MEVEFHVLNSNKIDRSQPSMIRMAHAWASLALLAVAIIK